MKTLVIPDVHQDLPWVRRILDKETDFDELVFLGDYYDEFETQPFCSPKSVTKYMHSLTELYDDVTFLIGNHDAQYLAFRGRCPPRRNDPTPFEKRWQTNGYTRNRCSDISRYLTTSILERFKLAKYTQGFLLSHAGVLGQLLTDISNVQESAGDTPLDRFLYTANSYCPYLSHHTYSPLFWIGKYRDPKSHDPYPGIIWCDFDAEFDNTIDVPQIVGHTIGDSVRVKNVGTPNAAYCLDAEQTAYGVILDGVLSIHTT